MNSSNSAKSISSALGSVDAKKESLRKAFEDLQSHSSSLASFTLQWKDLEEHFDSIKKSIEGRLKELEPNVVPVVAVKDGSGDKISESGKSESFPEMKSFCAKNDGLALRSYILKHRKEIATIRDDVGLALQSASDPSKLVLDAMKGFYPPNNSKGDKDVELAALRRTCLLLLEQLITFSPQITPEIKDRAVKLALEWKAKLSSGTDNPLEPLALLQLIATYGLISSFSVDEILDLAVSISRRKQATDLIRDLGVPHKIPDFIQKLTSNGKQLEAVKFVYAFELVDKFPPVPLLKDYFKHSKKVAQDIRNKGNNSVQSLNEATAKELAAVKAIIKCIEEHKLEAEYPRDILDKRVEQLEKQKADKKRSATGASPADKKRPATGASPADKNHQQQFGNKRPRQTGTRTLTSTVPSVPQTHMQPGSSLMDRYAPYMSSSSQYGLVGSTPTAPSYMTPGAGTYNLGTNPVSSYSLGANPVSYGVNLSPSRSHMYPPESHLTAGLYDRPMSYGSHGMPPSHRPSYYP